MPNPEQEKDARAAGFSAAANDENDPNNASPYVVDPEGDRFIRNNRGERAGPGEVINLTPAEARGITGGGYKLEPAKAADIKAHDAKIVTPKRDGAGQQPTTASVAKQAKPSARAAGGQDPTLTPALPDADPASSPSGNGKRKHTDE